MHFRRARLLVLLLGILAFTSTQRLRAAEPTEFPKEARKRFDEGDELRRKQRYAEAIKAFDEAIKLGMADYPRVYLYRAEAVRGLKSYDSAIAQYTSFIERFGIEDSCRY